MTESVWVDVLGGEAVALGTSRTVTAPEGHKIVVFHSEEGRWFAVHARCPHEGYPLSQGQLKGCVLTCAWHNWKFDLSDAGRCILGGEGVQTWPVRLREGRVEVDLSEPDPARVRPGIRASLYEAIEGRRNGQAFRDGVRLLMTGYEPVSLLVDLAHYDAMHGEFGTTHTLPLAADCSSMLGAPNFRGFESMQLVAPVIDLCSQRLQRLPRRPTHEPLPFEPEAMPERLIEAVEAEDVAQAEGLLRGAFRAGVEIPEIERWMYAVISRHFTDFGHELIYLVKIRELFARAQSANAPVDTPVAEDIYAALLHATVLSTREDTLPYMRAYTRRVVELEAELEACFHAQRLPGDDPADAAQVTRAVLDGSAGDAVHSVWSALQRGVSPANVAQALVVAAAERLARFDIDVDARRDVAETWLWCTHRLTFACAVYQATLRFLEPDVLRFLFQAVAFVHSGRGMDLGVEARTSPRKLSESSSEEGSVERILAAIRSWSPAAATLALADYLRDDGAVEALCSALDEISLEDRYVLPIHLAHAVKTTVAVTELVRGDLASHPGRNSLLFAVIHYLAGPIVERRVQENVQSAIQWVAHGLMPRKLTQ